MVCSIGNGRMAVMARLLVAGSLSQNIAGGTKNVHDMHVFGLMPMTDPLDLVCCNACKKPVMASQYAAHAEVCRLLNSAEEMTLELDGGTGCRKPPRKERKKGGEGVVDMQRDGDQATSVGERERSESIVADDSVASESHLDGQPRVPSCFSLDKKNVSNLSIVNSPWTDIWLYKLGGHGLKKFTFSCILSQTLVWVNLAFAKDQIGLLGLRGFEAAAPTSFLLLKLVALSRSGCETRKPPHHSNPLFEVNKSKALVCLRGTLFALTNKITLYSAQAWNYCYLVECPSAFTCLKTIVGLHSVVLVLGIGLVKKELGRYDLETTPFLPRNSASIDVASMMDGEGVIPENTDYSACAMPPPTKRYKFISTEHRLLSDDPETASGLEKVTSTVDPFSYIPVPLATKVYYSQRNTHLRSAVAYLHHAASSEGLQNNMMSSGISQKSIMQLQASSQRGSLDAQIDGLTKEKSDPSVHQPDQILAQSSEMCCVDKSGGCPPLTNFSNQCPVDNIQIPQAASIGMLRSKYLPKPYSFAGKPGGLLISSTVTSSMFLNQLLARHDLSQSLGTMQQPSGTVPVL
ncbi:hypothetical protein POTOM_032271 [Populus tomentosa]|uniref:Uncharacterized protein n=1 Tax=Populus tomentosa TaxID=118781 RepID=A0A8X7ZK27_POPTO|nr:hypothetical protein POTOM_032271 [Populus tomentosa]